MIAVQKKVRFCHFSNSSSMFRTLKTIRPKFVSLVFSTMQSSNKVSGTRSNKKTKSK